MHSPRRDPLRHLRRLDAVGVATVIGALAAVVGVVFGYMQLHETSAAQRRAETRGQAESISAAILPVIPSQANSPQPLTRIGLYNKSDAPVTDVVVTLIVNGQEQRSLSQLSESDQERAEFLKEYQRYISSIPPEATETTVSGDWHAGSAQASVAVAFVDRSGRNWLRKATGALVQLPTAPDNYYHLHEPVYREQPTTLQSK